MTKEQLFAEITRDSHHEIVYKTCRSGVYCPYTDHRHFEGWMIEILVNVPENRNGTPFSGMKRSKFNPDELKKTVIELQSSGFATYLDGIDVLAEQEYLSALKQAQQKYAITTGRSIVENPPFIDVIQEAGIETLGVRYNFESHNDFSTLHPRLAITALDIAKNKGLKTRIVTIITRENYNQIPYYCEFCEEQGYDEILLENYSCRQTGQDCKYIMNDNEHFACIAIIDEQRQKFSDKSLRIITGGYLGRCENQSCLACDKTIVMAPNGMLYPCKHHYYGQNGCGIQRSGALCVRNDSRPSAESCKKIHLSSY